MLEPARRRGFTVVEMIIVVAVIALIAVISIPGVLASRKNANETSAAASLRLIAQQQVLFKESDKEGDGESDYATLAELAQADLIDDLLGAGAKSGYVFELAVSPTRPDALWICVASPVVPGSTGDRFFAVNHGGIVFYTGGPAPVFNTGNCLIPAGMMPIGR